MEQDQPTAMDDDHTPANTVKLMRHSDLLVLLERLARLGRVLSQSTIDAKPMSKVAAPRDEGE